MKNYGSHRKRNAMMLVIGLWIEVLLPDWTYATPLSDPQTVFPTTTNSIQPSPLWLDNHKPYPTNAWFINFALGQEHHAPSEPVNVLPYMMRVQPQGISLSYKGPRFYAEPAYPNSISALYYYFDDQITLGIQEPITRYGLASYNNLFVTMQWQTQASGGFIAPIVQGSPYLTGLITQATPQLTTRFKLLTVNQNSIPGVLPSNSRYELKMAATQQHTQTWILYTEKPLVFTWSTTPHGDTLIANQSYTGWVRLVLQEDGPSGLVNDPAILDKYSSTIPMSYSKSYAYANNKFIYSLKWHTQNNQAPLMLSLPHHRNTSDAFVIPRVSNISYAGIKGLMLGETTKQWDMELPTPTISFLEPKNLNNSQKNSLKNALVTDAQNLLQYPFPDDGPYRTGKRFARAAQLIVFANRLEANELQKNMIAFIEQLLIKKMTEKTNWRLEYDATWGGIIPSIDDYGAKHYNDHHYHYGYWVYTFAVLAQFDPAWLTTPLKGQSFTPKQWIDLLIRDYANPNAEDMYFPMQRYQDDYAGHSWASGLTAFSDGQNQQSVSEAVNAYYALALYAKATHDDTLFSWGQFLTAREILSGQFYWQVKRNSLIYSPQFWENNWIVANLWGAKVDTNTFFYDCKLEYRCGLEYAFGIEMIPFNAISLQLLDGQWLAQAYDTIKKIILNQYGPIPDSWRWILIKGIAEVMPSEERAFYFQKAVDSNPEEYDNGDSKTNTLYFLMNSK